MRISQLVLILMLLGIVLVSGCANQPQNQPAPPPYIPPIDLKISPDTSLNAPIELGDNQTNLFTLTIKKLDEANKPTYFVLKFKPSNPDYLYPIEAESNTKIKEKQTEMLTQKGREFTYQFRVLGRKVPGQPESPWKMDIEVLYNNTILKQQPIYITVK